MDDEAGDPLSRQLEAIASWGRGQFAFYVADPATGRLATLRAGDAFPAASVIKLPIMLRLLQMAEAGEAALDAPLVLSPDHRTGGSGIFQHFSDGLVVPAIDACTAMVALSDNTATNMVLDVTGIEGVNRLLDALDCPRTRLHRYFGRPEMAGPAGPSQAVPEEIGRLLLRLVRGDGLSPGVCRRAVIQLRRQTHRAIIPRYLPEGTAVAHKTGSLNGVRHDAGILWLPRPRRTQGGEPGGPAAPADDSWPAGTPIVFVGMSRDVQDRRWTADNEAELLIARAARAAYDAAAAGW